MRAVVFEAFGNHPRIEDVPEPVAAEDGVVIEVMTTGVCRSDWHGWMGHDPDIRRLPHVPGHEFAGVVASVGRDVRDWRAGQRVTVPFVVCATFTIARAVLRVFRRQNRGTLVIVNSLLGSIVAPEPGAYVTAKWGQAGMIRALQIETRNQRGINICSVSPGRVNTPIYRQAANYTAKSPRPPIPVDPPEKVARAIVRCMDKPKARVSVGLANPVAILGFRLFPAVFDSLVTPLLHAGSLINPPTKPSTGNVFELAAEGEGEHGPWSRRWHPRGTTPRPDDDAA